MGRGCLLSACGGLSTLQGCYGDTSLHKGFEYAEQQNKIWAGVLAIHKKAHLFNDLALRIPYSMGVLIDPQALVA